jgi:hypothetical protein
MEKIMRPRTKAIILLLIISCLVFVAVTSVTWRSSEKPLPTTNEDKISVGYTVNDGSGDINDPDIRFTKREGLIAVISYAKMVTDNSNQKARLVITNTNLSNSYLIKEWVDQIGGSGMQVSLKAEQWPNGTYLIELYRNEKLVAQKYISLE